MLGTSTGWLPWALLSASFAALTAIFGKIGVANVNADLATLIRTAVILSARVAPIDKLSVVLVAVFGTVFLSERLSGLNWLGVALIGAGALLVAYKA